MTVSIMNGRRRMTTLLVPVEDGVQVVRIPSGRVARGLPDAVLGLPQVQAAIRSGEFVMRHEAAGVRPVVRGGHA